MLYDPNWRKNAVQPVVSEQQKLLLDMANYIEKHGWTQGCHRRWWGAVCIIGAFDALMPEYGSHTTHEAMYSLSRSLPNPIAVWNDQKGRTKQEVVNKLREVAHAV